LPQRTELDDVVGEARYGSAFTYIVAGVPHLSGYRPSAQRALLELSGKDLTISSMA
jgi:hypothetical protein